MFTNSDLSYFVAGLTIGIIITIAACWHEARKARAKGRREGFNHCEDLYCQRIQEVIQQTRTELGLPPRPIPRMPADLKDSLMAKWSPIEERDEAQAWHNPQPIGSAEHQGVIDELHPNFHH